MLTRELIEKRSAALARAKAAGIDNPAEFDAAMADVTTIDGQIERAKQLEDAERRAAGQPLETPEAAAGQPPEVRGIDGARVRLPTEFRGQVWRTAEGQAYPVLAPQDRMATFMPAGGDSAAAELGLGGFLRVLHRGPSSELERRALGQATIGAGGAMVPTPLAVGVIDLLRANAVSIQAGAMTVPMDSGSLKLARQLSDPAGTWRAENAAITESDPVFDQVTLAAKTWAVRFNVSRELLEDGLNTDQAIRNILASAGAVALDRAVLVGSGSGAEPLGIRGQSGIQTESMGTNGATLAGWSPVLNAVQKLEDANSPTITAMVMAPRTARSINGFADTTGQPLLPPKRLEAIPSLVTTSMPVDETQGTSTNCSSIILGDFSKVMIGLRTQLTIQVLNERFADNGQIGFIGWMRADVALARPTALARILGLRP
jgi:HK97 family phage major capsid protein